MNSLPIQMASSSRRELAPPPPASGKRRLAGVLALSALALLEPVAAQAGVISNPGFTGSYAPSSWSVGSATAPGGTSGSYTFSASNTQLDIYGQTGGTARSYYSFYMQVPTGVGSPSTTQWIFSYYFNEISHFTSDNFGYVLGGSSTSRVQIANGGATSSGTLNFTVSAGEWIGFYVYSGNNSYSTTPDLRISGFSAPALSVQAVPEPTTLGLFAAGAAGFSLSRRRVGRMEKSAV